MRERSVWRIQGSISPTCAAFTRTDPKSAKKTDDLTDFLCFWDLCTLKLRVKYWWNRLQVWRITTCTRKSTREAKNWNDGFRMLLLFLLLMLLLRCMLFMLVKYYCAWYYCCFRMVILLLGCFWMVILFLTLIVVFGFNFCFWMLLLLFGC